MSSRVILILVVGLLVLFGLVMLFSTSGPQGEKLAHNPYYFVQRQAAWLYAQFVTAKSVSLRKTLVGLTPIRRSDLDSPALLAEAPRLGGDEGLDIGPCRMTAAVTSRAISIWRADKRGAVWAVAA